MIYEQFMTENQKKYLSHIKKHRKLVKECWRVFKKLKETNGLLADDFFYWTIEGNIENHDASKIEADEFYPFCQWFYPEPNAVKRVKYFLHGVNRHIRRNKHHPEYWVVIDADAKQTILDMPTEYIIEMMMDWCAISIAFENKPSEWYDSKGPKKIMSRDTLNFVDKWMPTIDRIYTLIPKPE